MNSFNPITPDDPRLTAYALGELEDDERAAVEAALAANPALRVTVEEIRATAAQLTAVLATEPLPETRAAEEVPWQAAAIIPGDDPRKLDGGPLAKWKWPRFPQAYYILGGLAAAAFAIVVVRNEPRRHVMAGKNALVEVTMARAPKAPETEAERDQASMSKAAAPEPQSAFAPVDAIQAQPAPIELKDFGKTSPMVLDEKKAEPAPLLEGAVEARREQPLVAKMAAPAPAGASADAGSDVIKLEPFEVATSRDTASTGLAGARMAFGSREMPAGAIGGRVREFNTESYGSHPDNEFIAVANEPRSTFSIDVDTASYSNVRRFLQGGELPPRDAVRIEELVNYFSYHYAPPTGPAPFAAALEVASAPWEPKHRLVRIGLKGREVFQANRPPVSLVFLLDISGSMRASNRLPLVKESMHLLLSRLRADDRVAIVTYAGKTGLALPSTPVARSREILAALDELQADGSTDGGMGIQLAYDIAKANFIPNGVNRVILCTDGDFNVGVTNQGDLVRLIQEKAKSRVFLTVLGFGMGNLKDSTLELLAAKGNGNYGYIDSRREAEKLLVEQVNGTLVAIAKDVKIQVEFNPAQVSAYRLIGYENRLLKKEDFNNDKIDAGEIGAGYTVTALYEIIPAGNDEPLPATSVDELKYQAVSDPSVAKAMEGGQRSAISSEKDRADSRKLIAESSISHELLTVNVRYKEPTGDVSHKLEFPLVDGGADFAAASGDFKFAASVAGFGLALRAEPMNGALLADVARWAETGIADDAGGYRTEFTGLVRQAQALVR